MPVDTNKAVASGFAGAASVVLVWVLGLFHVVVPPEVASALTMLVGTGAAWLIPHSAGAVGS